MPEPRARTGRNTIVEVCYPQDRGRIGIRGSVAPLSWEVTTPATRREGDLHVFELQLPRDTLVELKLVRNDEEWAAGRNYVLHAGDHLSIEPCFDATTSTLLPRETLRHEKEELAFTVLLPPTYEEQPNRRYPVVVAQDGQSMWSTSTDPFGVWNLDTTLDQLFEIGAVDELIVVAVETAERRLERLSPFPDPHHGGGDGPSHLRAIVDGLLPEIDRRYRTRPGRESRAALGSSMGGLFSFWAAWKRPEVFGKAACLSSSFWWAQRRLVREVQLGTTPDPRPFLYVDSGVAMSAGETDPSARDGFHHTRSMLRALVRHGYVPGQDLYRLTFAGQRHDAAAWAARIAIPLQLLFPPPPTAEVPDEVIPEQEEASPHSSSW
jgi:predicted alpha/beta superfamily hydrolase